jgi:hypothetical protein
MIRIQIVGTQRSGSNLLRLILAAHDGVFAPPSTHMHRVFRDLVPRYGSLDVHDHRLTIIEDVRRLVDLNAFAWRAGVPGAEEIERRWAGTSVAGLCRAVYDAAAESAGMDAWVCKCLENVHFLPELIDSTPDLAVVHLVRDGRDVALSFERVPVGPKHPYVAAREWNADQRAALTFERSGYEPFVRVRYEDLIASPADVVAGLCGALGLEFDPRSLAFHASAEAQEAPGRSPLWQNLNRPVLAGNAGNFTDPARRAFVALFEESAHDLLVELGYEPIYATCAREPPAAEIERFLARDQVLLAAARRDADRGVEALHRPQEEFVRWLRSPGGGAR